MHARFNHEADKIRVSYHLNELDMQFEQLISSADDASQPATDERIYQAQMIKQSI